MCRLKLVHIFFSGKDKNLDNQANWQISTMRALKIAESFKREGIELNKIYAVGYGDKHPLKEDADIIDYIDMQNTRIEIVVKKPKIKAAENYELVIK